MEINAISTPAMGSSTPQSGIKPSVEVQPSKQKEEPVTGLSKNSQQARTEEIQKQVENVNSRLEQLGMGVSFSVDTSTQEPVVKVIDRVTDEVIKQFPNEDSLKRMQHIQSYLSSVQPQNGGANKESLTGTLFNEII